MNLRLNDFARFRFGPPITCELLLEQRRYRIHSPELAAVVLGLAESATDDEVLKRIAAATSRENADQIRRDLVEGKVLVPDGYEHPLAAEASVWVEHGWTEALALQRATDNLEFVDIRPATGQAQGRTESSWSVPDALPLWLERDVEYLALPTPTPWPDRSLSEVMLARRTHVPWSQRPVDAAVLSRILHGANLPLVRGRRIAEQGGNAPEVRLKNLFGDFETYVAIHDVDGFAPGLYHYQPRDHTLGALRNGDVREELVDTFVGQSRAGGGAFAVILSVTWERHLYRYPDNQRGYRTIMILAGQLAHRYIMGSTAFGLVTFPTPAHNPEGTDALLGTERLVESAIYLVSVG